MIMAGGSFSKALKSLDPYYKKYGYGAFSKSKSETSLFSLLKRDFPEIAINNQGRSGSTVKDLDAQFNKLSKKLLDKINYFIIVIGNNDVCGHYKNPKFIEEFEGKLLNIIANLYKQFKNSQIFLLPAFNLTALLNYKDLRLSDSLQMMLSSSKSKTCFDMQKQMCPLFLDTSKSNADIEKIRSDINKTIKKSAENKNYKDRSFYIEELEQVNIDDDFLATDCFHPSAPAHNTIADILYRFIKSKNED